jgi:hypothetical protein
MTQGEKPAMNLSINLHATPHPFVDFNEEETFMNCNPWVIANYEPNPVSGVSYLRIVIRETEYAYDWCRSDVIESREHVMYFKDDDEGPPFHLKLSWVEKSNDNTCLFEVIRLSTVWAHPSVPFNLAPFHK